MTSLIIEREIDVMFLSIYLGDDIFHTLERIERVTNLIIQPWLEIFLSTAQLED